MAQFEIKDGVAIIPEGTTKIGEGIYADGFTEGVKILTPRFVG